MKCIEVCRATSLHGSVRVQGSKNSSLALMAAACLSDGIVTLDNIPDISDVHTFLDILREIGANADFTAKNRIVIDPGNISQPTIDPAYTQKVRPAYYFIGSLLAKHKSLTLGYPGGDMLGQRPIDQHIKGFASMGAQFDFSGKSYMVSAEKLNGAEIYFDVITAGAQLI
jgi:UDP-N-acetylglucosamine 1-carboxyvinyltransferase